ncbi:hypothetical protein [Streptomyces griseus]
MAPTRCGGAHRRRPAPTPPSALHAERQAEQAERERQEQERQVAEAAQAAHKVGSWLSRFRT